MPLALPEQEGHVDHPLLLNVLADCFNHQDDIGVVYNGGVDGVLRLQVHVNRYVVGRAMVGHVGECPGASA